MNSDYEKKKHQLTGDTIWKINDIDLAITDGGSSIVKDFIDENKYDDYTLYQLKSLKIQLKLMQK